MRYFFLVLLTFLYTQTIVVSAEKILFADDFSGTIPGKNWSVSGGNISVAGNALLIRSDKSNPVVYLKDQNWQKCRITFVLIAHSKSAFNLYVGWNYPRYVKLTFNSSDAGKLAVGSLELGQKIFNFDKKIDLNVATVFDIKIIGKEIICKINNVEAGRYQTQELISGSLAFGGAWGSNLEIRNLKVEGMAIPEPEVVDKFSRPEIKNGTFYVNGRPTFMLGVNDAANFWEFGSFNAQPPFEPNDVFTDIMSRKTAEKMGFNADHVPTYARQVCDGFLDEIGITPKQAELLLGKSYKHHWSQRDRLRERISGLPLIVDFSFLHLFTMANLPQRIKEAGYPAELRHDGGFMPYIPELPIGKKIYDTYFKAGAKYWLDYGKSNPWVYELFNEVQWYNSKHKLNKELFASWLRKKYGTIAALGNKWEHEAPEKFEDVVNLSPWSGNAMCADWMMFLGDRFVEIFNDGKAAIESVDPRRKNVYFDIEISVSSLWYAQNGIDYHKLMKSADIFGTEGGMPFGVFSDSGKSYLDDVMNNSKIKVMFYCDLARSFAGDKPVLNQESYVRRTYGKLGIVPTHRSDFPTSFWFEIFHGYSGAFTYCWWQGYKNNKWKTLEDARKTANEIPPALLNPYAYPFESLKGFKDFNSEIWRLAEVALPYPRVTQEIGILYSLPTVWRQPHAVSGSQKFPYQQNCYNWYDIFLRRQLPVSVITEQELIEKGHGRFKVIAVPYPSHVFTETPEKLKEFAAKGGIVLIGAGALRFDPFGYSLKNSKLSGQNVYTIPAGVTVTEQAKLLNNALDASGYKAPFKVTAQDSKLLSELESRVIRRDGIDLYFICNWNAKSAGVVNLHAALLCGVDDKLYVTDMVRMAPVLSPTGKREWSADELNAGIPVAVPSQERVLIAVSVKPQEYSNTPPWTFKSIRAHADQIIKDLEKANNEFDQQLAVLDKAENEKYVVARKPYPVIKEKCFAVDISKAATMGFRDEKKDDHRGGWTDQGDMDFREFPTGNHVYAGVPFTIVEPSRNNGKSCIVLNGGGIKFLSSDSTIIPVGRKVKNLYFLHTAAWAGGEGSFFDYVIAYSDSTTEKFTVKGKKECADWVGNEPIENGVIAWEGKINGIPIGAYAVRWQNQKPEKAIASIQVANPYGKVTPIVLAITGEEQ